MVRHWRTVCRLGNLTLSQHVYCDSVYTSQHDNAVHLLLREETTMLEARVEGAEAASPRLSSALSSWASPYLPTVLRQALTPEPVPVA